MHIGVNDLAIKEQGLLLEQGIEVGPGKEFLGDLSTCDIVHFGLPVLFQADHEADAVGVTGPEPVQAGIGQVGQQAIAPPRLVDGQMAAVMLPGRTEMVLDWSPTAHREDLMHLDGGIASRSGELLKQRLAHRDGRGIDNVPVRHPAQGTRQVHRLGARIGQGTLGQDRHEPFQGLIEPPIEGGTCYVRHFKFQVRA
jgi:hypothetical protein